jgi:hypothetical protein
VPLLAQDSNDCVPADVGTRIRQHVSGVEPVQRLAPRRGMSLGWQPILKAAETNGTVLWPNPSVRPIDTANQKSVAGFVPRSDI